MKPPCILCRNTVYDADCANGQCHAQQLTLLPKEEHMSDAVLGYHAGRSEGGPVNVYDAQAGRIVATIPLDLGLPAEQWAMGRTIAALLLAAEERPFKLEGYRAPRLFRSADFRWRAVHKRNGEILAHGQGYSRRADMVATLNLLFPGVQYDDVDE